MDREATARNLQLALLAIEQQLIGAEDLARALGAWLGDPATPLAEILVRQQLLSPSQRARIDAFVNEQAAHAAHGVEGADAVHDAEQRDAEQREDEDDDEDENEGDENAPSLESFDAGLLASVREALGRLGDAKATAGFDQLLNTLSPRAGGNGPAVGDEFEERFEILGEHAHGGLGEVLLARDKQLNRRVALKQIRDRWARNADCRERFLQEAEVTGRLEHPGVVPVYALGKRPDGRLYYAMRFIRGESLEQAIKRFYARAPTPRNAGQRSVEFRQLLTRFVDVCNTIDYAHSRGIMHRDIKPANVMLGKYGETLVVDWGLAKPVDVGEHWLDSSDSLISPESGSGSSPTVLGSAVGTPHYMSPEQAAGRVNEMGPATDVFGLGATLYHLLTGQPPQNETSLSQLLERVERGDFKRPCEVRPETPKPLEAICLKAMARRASARYVTAGDLASDVERWLADEPVTVYREPAATRAVRFVRSRPALSAAAGVTFLLLCLSAVAANTFWHAAQRRETQHQAELRERELLRRLEREQDAARQMAVAAENRQAGLEELRAGRFPAALRLFQTGLDACRDDPQLDAQTRAGIEQQRAQLAQRVEQVQRLVDFQRLSDEAMFASFAEMDRHSMILFEAAFDRLGVLDHADWWSHLPIEDLNAREADRLIRQVHFQLAMLASVMAKNLVSPDLLVRRGAGLPPGPLSENQQLARDALQNAVALAQHYRRGQWVAHLAEGARYLFGDSPALPVPPQWRDDNFNDCYCVGSTCMIQVQVGDAGFMRKFLYDFLGVEDVRASADELLGRAVELRPQEYWANFSVGTLRRQEQRYEAARRAYSQCITIRPEIPLTYNLRGLCAYEQALATADESQRAALLRLALADAVTAHELAPHVEFNHWLRGFIYQQLGQNEDAAAAMLGALEREIPAEMVSRQRWAVSVMGQDLNLVRRTNYVFRDRFAEAARFAQQRLEKEPANRRYGALLAWAELARGHDDEALAAAERVTAAAGGDADEGPSAGQDGAAGEALYVQAEVLRRRGDLAKARKLFAAARSDGDRHDAVLAALAAEGLASILEQDAEGASDKAVWESALAAYEKFVSAAQTDWQQIRSHVGRCRVLLRLDRETEALQTLDEALRLDRGLDAADLRTLAERQGEKRFLARLDAIRPHARLAGMFRRVNEMYTTLPLRNGDFGLGLAEFWGNADAAAPIWWNQNGCRSTADVTRDQRQGGEASLHVVHISPRSTSPDKANASGDANDDDPASDNARNSLATMQQALPAEPGRYRLTLWAKAEHLSDDALRIVVDGVEQPVVTLPGGSYDWRELRGEFSFTGDGDRPSAGLGELRLRIVSLAPGESWLDDLRIELIGPLDANPN